MSQPFDQQRPRYLSSPPPALQQCELPGSRPPLAAIAFAGQFASQQVDRMPESSGTPGEDHP